MSTSLIILHIAVFLFGFSALFGKLILQDALVIVFGRTLIGAISLFSVLQYSKIKIFIKSKKDFYTLMIAGVLFAIHWFTFFKSIQLSTVAIGALTFSTYPVFVTFLEPYFFKQKLRLFDVVIAMITLFGVFLIVPKFDIADNFTWGVIYGLFAAISGAYLSILCKMCADKYSSALISFYQCAICSTVLLPFVIWLKPVVGVKDVFFIILLGTVFTALSGTLFIKSLKSITVQLASITSSLEPVYAIIFSVFLLNEIPSYRTILGGLVILGSVIMATLNAKENIYIEH